MISLRAFSCFTLLVATLFSVEPSTAVDSDWIELFNGEDLDGWTPKITHSPLGENFANTFRVNDGAIQVRYDGYDEFGGRFGHLFYEHEYAHYVLRMEYRFTGEQCKGGPGWAFRNSGVMIHGQDPKTMRLDQEFPVSIEVQLLGGDGGEERSTANLCTPGTNIVIDDKLVKTHCLSSSSETYHGNRWVELEVEVRGNRIIRHRVNGETVFEFEQPQLDERDADARAWVERRGGDLSLSSGSISLQSESHPCEFRNLRLRPLRGGE